MENILRVALWKLITSKVKGDVDVNYITTDDKIIIYVNNQGLTYKAIVTNYVMSIAMGTETNQAIAEKFIKKYRSDLLNNFFK